MNEGLVRGLARTIRIFAPRGRIPAQESNLGPHGRMGHPFGGLTNKAQVEIVKLRQKGTYDFRL